MQEYIVRVYSTQYDPAEEVNQFTVRVDSDEELYDIREAEDAYDRYVTFQKVEPEFEL